MAYHLYFTTPSPANHSENHHNTPEISYQFFSLIIFLGGISCICLYSKYTRQHRYERDGVPAIGQEYEDYEESNDDENEDVFPDIHDYFPNYLDRDRVPRGARGRNRIPNPVLPPPPPAYDNSASQNLEPPSYDSIVNPRAEAECVSVNNNVNNSQSTV